MRKYNKDGLLIDPVVYQHPADKAAIEAIKKAPAFAKVLEFISKNSVEKYMGLINMSSYIHLTDKTSPKLFEMLHEAMEMFGLEKEPDLFIERDYNLVAYIRGIESPYIKFTNAWLEAMSDDDDMTWGCVAGNISGMKNGYAQMRFIQSLLNFSSGLIPELLAAPLKGLFANWFKYAQFSLDRSMLLATRDFNTTMRIILCGEAPMDTLRSIDFVSPDNSYRRQCTEFLGDRGTAANIARGINALTNQAFYATRYMRLLDFYNSEYYDILDEYC